MSEPKPLLSVQDLRVHFNVGGGTLKAVDGVDFQLFPGETLALVGESGCGKSTLARALVGLNPITSGRALLGDQPITGISRQALRSYRKELQLVFQDPYASLNPRFTIAETLAEPLLLHGKATRKNADAKVCELLSQVGLDTELRQRYPHEFSGGQRQRISIARALAVEPRLLLCDEVTSALDVSIQAQILDLLRSVQRARGISYLFITHDLGVVRYIAHRVAVMYVGQIVELRQRYPHEFSGGQRQRISIARALAVEPRLLLCDEVTSALDVSIQAQILDLLRSVQRARGISYLFITHDLGVVRYIAHRVAVMYVGQIVELRETESLFESPAHPYTKALLSSIPRVARASGERKPLSGEVPSPARPPSGCRFHPRCPQAFERCPQEAPSLVPVPQGQSRCFLNE